jgi:hypothetical protein
MRASDRIRFSVPSCAGHSVRWKMRPSRSTTRASASAPHVGQTDSHRSNTTSESTATVIRISSSTARSPVTVSDICALAL